MKRNAAALAALSVVYLVCATSTSRAAPYYFHKTNVDRSIFAAEFSECTELASGVTAPRYNVYMPDNYSMAASYFFAGLFGSMEQRRMIENVMRTCMADKGYRRIEPPKEIKKELDRLSEQERLDRLFALTAAPEPVGKVLPR